MFKSTIVAGLGGFVGTVLRFLSEKLGAILCHGAFPLGTFMANICGCFLIGIFYGWVSKKTFMTKQLNVFLITGLCGGFTTFSSMSDEFVNLLQTGHEGTFIAYLLSSLILGLLMVVAGIACVPANRSITTQNS